MHNNAYKQPELPECFERNAEGMLKNMAIHELALLATYWGVTVDNIKSVTPDVEYSSCQTLTGPSGKAFTFFAHPPTSPICRTPLFPRSHIVILFFQEFTDFSKVGFTIETKDGVTVTVRADRCGSTTGGDSQVNKKKEKKKKKQKRKKKLKKKQKAIWM